MRIAISGTHFTGKSTLIANFLVNNAHYCHHQEPYYELLQQYLYEGELSMDSMRQQLIHSIRLLDEFSCQQDSIFDRCPLDYIAYMMSFAEQDDFDLADSEISDYFEQVADVLKTLDLIVFLPISAEYSIEYIDNDVEMRDAADYYLKKLYRSNQFGLLPNYNNPTIVELVGDQSVLLDRLELITSNQYS